MAEVEPADRNPRFFVAVHVGAGFHAPSNKKTLRTAMKRACLAAASVLRKYNAACSTCGIKFNTALPRCGVCLGGRPRHVGQGVRVPRIMPHFPHAA
ncbi:hypothetical protein Vadar_019377 [Vaccinium darrowii]|uniref:Uncharacterized protein n=1 Tax=Vaccinium darrowii TaxID=229202 RepID=A0ACB7YER3_9ERIC|nr:hypothetical protein Vadar_019377 [Vaccinium darrowii]